MSASSWWGDKKESASNDGLSALQQALPGEWRENAVVVWHDAAWSGRPKARCGGSRQPRTTDRSIDRRRDCGLLVYRARGHSIILTKGDCYCWNGSLLTIRSSCERLRMSGLPRLSSIIEWPRYRAPHSGHLLQPLWWRIVWPSWLGVTRCRNSADAGWWTHISSATRHWRIVPQVSDSPGTSVEYCCTPAFSGATGFS